MRIIFVNTPGHSRSTVTGALLSNLPDAICLGETYNFFSHDLSIVGPEFSNLHCSCGKLYQECSFWGDFYTHDFKTIEAKYGWLVNRCKEFGFKTIIETCSKNECLRIWEKTGLPITIVKMRKPFFKWLSSMRNREKRLSLSRKSVIWYLRHYYIRKLWGRQYFTKGIKVDYYELEKIIGWDKPSHHIAVANRCKYTLPGSTLPSDLKIPDL